MNEASDLCPSRLATQFCHIREGRDSEVGPTFLTAPELACVPRIQVNWVPLRCLPKSHHAAPIAPPRRDPTLSSGLNRWLRTFLECKAKL